jgi:hypothetical protein
MVSATRSLRRNAPAKPRAISARSRLPPRVSGMWASIFMIRSAAAGAFCSFAVPIVRRMPFHRRAHGLGAHGRLMAGQAMGVPDGSGPARDGGCLGASMRLGGQERGEDGRRGRQRLGTAGRAPGGEQAPVAAVGPAGRCCGRVPDEVTGCAHICLKQRGQRLELGRPGVIGQEERELAHDRGCLWVAGRAVIEGIHIRKRV